MRAEENQDSYETSLRQRVLRQMERVQTIVSALETARLNQGLTDGMVRWAEDELTKVSVSLTAIAVKAEMLENAT